MQWGTGITAHCFINVHYLQLKDWITDLDHPIYIQASNPATRNVNSKEKGRMDEKSWSDISSSGINVTEQKGNLQCMMDEWCSPYSSWLSLMNGCSVDRPPAHFLPLKVVSTGSPEVSTSSVSPFFSAFWRYRSKQMTYSFVISKNKKKYWLHLILFNNTIVSNYLEILH